MRVAVQQGGPGQGRQDTSAGNQMTSDQRQWVLLSETNLVLSGSPGTEPTDSELIRVCLTWVHTIPLFQ